MDRKPNTESAAKRPQEPHTAPDSAEYGHTADTLTYISAKVQGFYFRLGFPVSFRSTNGEMSRPTVKPASKPPATVSSIKEEKKPASRSDTKLPTTEPANPVLRSMQSTKVKYRRPSVKDKSREVHLHYNKANLKTSPSNPPAAARATQPTTAVEWRPPESLGHRKGHTEKDNRGRKLSSPPLTVGGDKPPPEGREKNAGLGRIWPKHPWAEKATAPVDAEHQAANALIDDLDGMFRPALQRFEEDLGDLSE